MTPKSQVFLSTGQSNWGFTGDDALKNAGSYPIFVFRYFIGLYPSPHNTDLEWMVKLMFHNLNSDSQKDI